MPTNWSASGEAEQYGDPLFDRELDKLGRSEMASQVAAAQAAGVDAWGWLPDTRSTADRVPPRMAGSQHSLGAAGMAGASTGRRGATPDPDEITIGKPDKTLFPDAGITKQEDWPTTTGGSATCCCRTCATGR